MKQIFSILLGAFITLTSFAGVEIRSFYFDPDSKEITAEAREIVEEFHELYERYYIQVIEMNGYSQSADTPKENEKIAQHYIEVIRQELSVDESQMTINNYSNNQIKLNFTPGSWNRVDIYFYQGEEKVIIPDVLITETADTDTSLKDIDLKRKAVPVINEIAQNDPIVMPIRFEGGSTKIDEEETGDYLDYLYNTMVKHPELYAHIRGHVCCKKRWLRSRRRAKAVYKYLVDKGIDKKRISFMGYSNARPRVYPEITAADRNANRRVDVVFTDYKARKHRL